MFKQPFKHSLLPNDGLQHIQKKLITQRKLLHLVKSNLPENLAPHCIHVTESHNKITLFTDSSVWASKLLYLRQAILKNLSLNHSATVKSLKVTVLSRKGIKEAVKLKPVSSASIQFLAQANETDQEDTVSAAMNRLVTTLRKNRSTR